MIYKWKNQEKCTCQLFLAMFSIVKNILSIIAINLKYESWLKSSGHFRKPRTINELFKDSRIDKLHSIGKQGLRVWHEKQRYSWAYGGEKKDLEIKFERYRCELCLLSHKCLHKYLKHWKRSNKVAWRKTKGKYGGLRAEKWIGKYQKLFQTSVTPQDTYQDNRH